MSSVRVLAFTQDALPLAEQNNFEFFKRDLEDLTWALLSDLLREHRPNIILSFQSELEERPRAAQGFALLAKLPFQQRKIWLHLPSPAEVTQAALEACYMTAAMGHKLDNEHPLVTVATTSYLSGHRIARSFLSLLGQSYNNWEWLVFDDSPPDSGNWDLLLHVASLDFRVRPFRGQGNDGVIGSVKRNVSMLARGQFVVELDHDDILTPDLLQVLVLAGKAHPEAGFFYSDFTEIHEAAQRPLPGKALEGSETNFKYGDNWGFGYGAYVARLYPDDLKTGPVSRQKWRYVAQAPPLNYRTLRHIVAMPNHVRAWKTSLYRQLGGHNSELPVADDYELCLRSFMAAPCVRLPVLGYLQFRNQGGNNFTFHRNALIGRLTLLASAHHFSGVHKRLRALGLPDPLADKEGRRTVHHEPDCQIWTRPQDFPPRAELTFLPDSATLATVIAVVGEAAPRDISDLVLALKGQTHQNWELLILGNECDGLEGVMNDLAPQCDHRVGWWNVDKPSYDDPVHMRNYGLLMAARGSFVTYVRLGEEEKDMYGNSIHTAFRPAPVAAWAPDHLRRLIDDYGVGCYRTKEGEFLIHPGPASFPGIRASAPPYRYWLKKEDSVSFLERWGREC